MKQTTYFELDYSDFDILVNKNFPVLKNNYECVAYNEWGNYESHSFEDVDGSEYEEDELLESDDFKWNTNQILHTLVKLGKLESGNYKINIFW